MCTTPITLRKGTPDSMTVGCGRCMPCFIKYCNQWAFRFSIHAAANPVYWCITLTYNNKHLPTIRDGSKIYMTLIRAHVTNFMKQVRNKHNKRYKNKRKPPVSYIVCGEYGDQFKRPHYHAIVFGVHPDEYPTISWPQQTEISSHLEPQHQLHHPYA